MARFLAAQQYQKFDQRAAHANVMFVEMTLNPFLFA
jgi:hypothetical protein